MKALHARGLVDKRDNGITWSWELRPEGKAYLAASGTSGCAMCDDLKSENAALREKVEAWEWWEEVRTYDPWSEHPYCTACGNRSKRGKIFDCAVDEYEKIKSTAREAVHADRE